MLAVPASHEMVTDLKMPTPPKRPASRQLISPPVGVTAKALRKVAHGAPRLQSLLSSPFVPDTQVCCAFAGEAASNASSMPASKSAILLMMESPLSIDGRWLVRYCRARETLGPTPPLLLPCLLVPSLWTVAPAASRMPFVLL